MNEEVPQKKYRSALFLAKFLSYIGVVLVVIALLQSAMVHAMIILPRTLKEGDRGEDVRTLQKFLNSNPETKIAANGPGSPGNETDYFGFATQEAVKKYQRIHADAILVPAGLSFPTGIAGTLTRAHMVTSENQIVSQPEAQHSTATTSDFLSHTESSQTNAIGEVEAASFAPNPGAIQTCAILSFVLPFAALDPLFMPICITFYDDLFRDLAEDLGIDGGGGMPGGGGGDSQNEIKEKVEKYVKDQLMKGCSIF